jgi:hypothetical protein
MLVLVRRVYRLPLPGYGRFRSGVIFEIFLQKTSKADHFTFGPTGLSFAVAEIRSLSVCSSFRVFSSKIIKNDRF